MRNLILPALAVALLLAPAAASAAQPPPGARIVVPKARGPVETVAGKPRTLVGRIGRGALKLGSGAARLGGLGATVVGVVTMNPLLAGGGVALSYAGNIGKDVAHSWGGTRVARDGRRIPKLRGVKGVVSKALRGSSFVGRKVGGGLVLAGLFTLNPVLVGGGAATWVGGRVLRRAEQPIALHALNVETRDQAALQAARGNYALLEMR